MKVPFYKITVIILLALLFNSCSKESVSKTESSSSTTTTSESQTWVKLTAVTTSNEKKANYTIMMFADSATNSMPLPTIIQQVITDANGLAFFDLNTIVTSETPKKYYFEAFTPSGSNYTWKSISHVSTSIKKGTMFTTGIIVN